MLAVFPHFLVGNFYMKNYRINDIRNILRERSLLYPLDVALIGATGVGKSSTINGLFGSEVAKVGSGVDPETMHVTQYAVNDVFRLHDTAGLGDGLAADKIHAKNLTQLLLQTCKSVEVHQKEYGFIDLALVILDGSHRDLGTTYKILEQVVLECIPPDRVIIAINQADMAMKRRGWNSYTNQPEANLLQFLEEKSVSVQQRIKEATGISVKKPTYYSAYYGYNLDKLLDHIVSSIPRERRTMNSSRSYTF